VMGCDSCDSHEKPEHAVELTKPFQMGRTEVTEKHWNAVMSGKATGSNKPRVNLSWNEAQAFIAKLNARADGFHYRLPTEAEWEYCARAGDGGVLAKNLEQVAWTSDNSGRALQEVASAKMPNAWGLYDMLGNASEWTNDYVAEDYYQTSPLKDPKGPKSGEARIVRGGNAGTNGMIAHYAVRMADKADTKGEWIGFRVVRERK